MRIFLSTQIADEARHVQFFNRFYDEVGVLDGADGLAERLARDREEPQPGVRASSSTGCSGSRVDRLAAEPEDTETLVEAMTLYHMVIEGVLALTGQHFIIGYNTEQGTLPGFVEGFSNVARDEHRHVAFGARFLTDMAAADDRYRDAIQRTLVESLPVAEKVLDPPLPEEDDDFELFGASKRGDPGLRRAGADPAAQGHRPRLSLARAGDGPDYVALVRISTDDRIDRMDTIRSATHDFQPESDRLMDDKRTPFVDSRVPPNPPRRGSGEDLTWERRMSTQIAVAGSFGQGCPGAVREVRDALFGVPGAGPTGAWSRSQ